jgi:AcrR family transcriptional regulator
VREILDGAWSLMAREGAAALSVREVARLVGMRQQSLTHYFPTKAELLDALFADGFTDLRTTLEAVPVAQDEISDVVAVADAVAGYFIRQPARYQLMLQRSIPGFVPGEASMRITAEVLGVLTGRLAAAGVTDRGDVALVRALISGVAAEQIANDPNGREYVDQLGRGVRAVIAASANVRGNGGQRQSKAGGPGRGA